MKVINNMWLMIIFVVLFGVVFLSNLEGILVLFILFKLNFKVGNDFK